MCYIIQALICSPKGSRSETNYCSGPYVLIQKQIGFLYQKLGFGQASKY